MSFASTARKVTAFAAAAATLLALGACGNSNNGSAGNNGAKSTSEPQEGVPTNYTGSFPMPDADVTRWVSTQSLGSVIAFLLSDDASAITGACLPVAGRV